MTVKLWLDDVRNPKMRCHHIDDDTYLDAIWVKTPEEAIECFRHGIVSHISLDNDLGLGVDSSGKEIDGYSLMCWIEEQAISRQGFLMPIVDCHSGNPVASKRIVQVVRKLYLLASTRDVIPNQDLHRKLTPEYVNWLKRVVNR